MLATVALHRFASVGTRGQHTRTRCSHTAARGAAPDSSAEPDSSTQPARSTPASHSYAQQLCELAGRLHAAETARAAASPEPSHPGAAAPLKPDVWNMATDSKGTSGWVKEAADDLKARDRDRDALEAIGCTVAAAPGDLLLFFPGIFHRTQDVEHYRVSLIAEAT